MLIKTNRFLAPEGDGAGGAAPPDDDAILASLPDDARAALERHVAKVKGSTWAEARRTFKAKEERGSGTPGAPASSAAAALPAGTDPMQAINALVSLKIAEALGAMGGKPEQPLGPPVTSGGSPPMPSTVREDTPIHKLSIPDREALRRRIGDIEFKNRLFREMASVQITGVRR